MVMGAFHHIVHVLLEFIQLKTAGYFFFTKNPGLTKPVEFVQHMLSSVCGRIMRDSGLPPAWVGAPLAGALCVENLYPSI